MLVAPADILEFRLKPEELLKDGRPPRLFGRLHVCRKMHVMDHLLPRLEAIFLAQTYWDHIADRGMKAVVGLPDKLLDSIGFNFVGSPVDALKATVLNLLQVNQLHASQPLPGRVVFSVDPYFCS